MRTEGGTGELGDFAGGAFGEFGVGVEAGTDGGAADGEIVETIEGHGDARAVAVEKTDPAGKLLTHGEWRGVLQMGAAALADASKFLGLGVQGVAKFFHGGEQAAVGFGGGGGVAGRGD